MDDTTSLGGYLRAERERRGMTLRAISERTKVSVPFLEGLESDDISRWPGGIFRRAFVRAYAESVGLDPDDVFRRFEQQHRPASEQPISETPATPALELQALAGAQRLLARTSSNASLRTRYLGTAADLTVAVVLAFGSAAAGSRLLWPVLMIAGYYAAGILLTGTSPMVALLGLPEPAPSQPSNDTDAGEGDSLLGHSSARTIS